MSFPKHGGRAWPPAGDSRGGGECNLYKVCSDSTVSPCASDLQLLSSFSEWFSDVTGSEGNRYGGVLSSDNLNKSECFPLFKNSRTLGSGLANVY